MADGPTRPVRGRQFTRGNTAGQAGRPLGARNRLGEGFLEDLRLIWERDGPAALEEARPEKPMEFARMVAGLLPKELLIQTAPEDDMSDAELADTLAALRAVAPRH